MSEESKEAKVATATITFAGQEGLPVVIYTTGVDDVSGRIYFHVESEESPDNEGFHMVLAHMFLSVLDRAEVRIVDKNDAEAMAQVSKLTAIHGGKMGEA